MTIKWRLLSSGRHYLNLPGAWLDAVEMSDGAQHTQGNADAWDVADDDTAAVVFLAQVALRGSSIDVIEDAAKGR